MCKLCKLKVNYWFFKKNYKDLRKESHKYMVGIGLFEAVFYKMKEQPPKINCNLQNLNIKPGTYSYEVNSFFSNCSEKTLDKAYDDYYACEFT